MVFISYSVLIGVGGITCLQIPLHWQSRHWEILPRNMKSLKVISYIVDNASNVENSIGENRVWFPIFI